MQQAAADHFKGLCRHLVPPVPVLHQGRALRVLLSSCFCDCSQPGTLPSCLQCVTRVMIAWSVCGLLWLRIMD